MSEDQKFTSATLVALPTVDDPINERVDGDAHISLLWFGETDQLPPDLIEEIRIQVDGVTSALIGPFDADVVGGCVLGPDRAAALLIESASLVTLRNELSAASCVREAQAMADSQHPWWLPHLTLKYGDPVPTEWPDSVRIDAVGFWLAGQHTRYPLPPVETEDVPSIQDWSFLSAGLIPPIHSVDDLPLALAFAESHPDSQWYVQKRCAALGVKDRIPSQWGAR